MTIITGLICDSGNVPLTGTLDIELVERLQVAPSTIVTRKLSSNVITNGVVNLSLAASQAQRESYRFMFYTGTGTTRNVLLDFYAVVPDSPVAVNFSNLLPTAITSDVLDTSVKRLAEFITSDPVYVARVKAGFNGRGTYDITQTYYYNDIVIEDGSSYAYILKTPSAGKLLTDAQAWQPLAQKGANGTGTAGNSTAYGSSWAGATDAPSRGAIRNLVEGVLVKQLTISGLAPLSSPVFTDSPKAPTKTVTDNSTNIATTGFVYLALAPLISSPGASPSVETPPANSNSAAIANTSWVWSILAPLLSPSTPSEPRVLTATAGDASTRVANTNFVSVAVAAAVTALNASIASVITSILVQSMTTNSITFKNGVKFVWGTWVSTAGFSFAANTEYANAVTLPDSMSYTNILTMQLTLRAGLAATGMCVVRGTSNADPTKFDLIVKHSAAFTGQMFVSYFLVIN